jgi:hypothetical protein
MSGGSFDYVCFAVDSGEIFSRIGDLYRIEEYLRENEKHDAADEVLIYIKDLQTIERRFLALGRRMYDILQATEWWASCDWNEEGFDRTWKEFVYGEDLPDVLE